MSSVKPSDAGPGESKASTSTARESTWSGLLPRVISAVLLLPPVVAALYFGSPYSELLVAVAGGILAWEWSRLCANGALGVSGLASIFAVLVVLAAGALRLYEVASWLIAIGALATALIAGRYGPGRPKWSAIGVLYVALPCLAFLWLRQLPEIGRVAVFWLILVVWATDIGAYFAGRALGGPKLAPRASPKKTWSGLVGGAFCAALVGGLAAHWQGGWAPLPIAGASVLLALVAQTGDVLESAVKRHFRVKDASNLIPGHGGLMDRVDGLLAASLVVALIVWLRDALA